MTLYIENLNRFISSHHLLQLFSAYGLVTEATVIMNKDTQRSCCYGFIIMQNTQEAMQAKQELNNINFMDRFIKVSKA